MNLNETTVNIRPRTPYEAIDLGVSMVRAWWKEVWLIWFTVSLPFVICIGLLILIGYKWALLLLWWCKPLWETVLLHFVAEKLFNAKTSVRAIIRKAPRLIMNDLFIKVTLRRMSITRSFDMPVSELERLKSTARNKRLNVLHRTSSSAAIWLTFISFMLEITFIAAIAALIEMFTPEYMMNELPAWDLFNYLFRLEFLVYLFHNYNYLLLGLCYIVLSMVGPFYAASGFSLYINRRTILEGWDIELSFRQLASRAIDSSKKTVKSLAAAFLAITSFLHADLNSAYANELSELTPQQSRNEIIEILETDVFNDIRDIKVTIDRDKDDEDNSEEIDSFDNDFVESVSNFFGFIAQSLEVILWGLVIAVVVFLILKLSQYRFKRRLLPTNLKAPKTPDSLFGLDIRQESLPNDIIGHAKTLWQQGEYREAYSVLYRSALAFIAHEKQVPLHESFTEEECVQRFHAHDSGEQPAVFARLTLQWQMIAYGHHIPANETFEVICADWRQHFHQSEGVTS